MGWGFSRLAAILPGSKTGVAPANGADSSETSGLSEVDIRPSNRTLWLGGCIVAVILAGAGGFFAGRATVPAQLPASTDDSDYDDTTPAPITSTAPPQQQVQADLSAPARETPRRHYSHPGELQGAAVIAAAKPASGLMFVHRMNSDVRTEPSYDAQVIKKEAKGAQVQLVALSDKWAEIRDGATKGWMRSSVLKDTPPGEKRRKKDDDGN